MLAGASGSFRPWRSPVLAAPINPLKAKEQFTIFLEDNHDGATVAAQFLRIGIKEEIAALLHKAGYTCGHWRILFETWKNMSNNGPRFVIKNAGLACVYLMVRPGHGVNPA